MIRTVTSETISDAARELGLGDRCICLHSSLSSFGYVMGGADAVIDGFLAVAATLLVPTFSYAYEMATPEGREIEQNGTSTPASRRFPPPAPFTADAPVESSMGTVPRRLLVRPGSVRGNHPLNSFGALGRDATSLVAEQRPLDVYAPLRSLIARDGVLLLAGVGLRRLTALHLAEQMSGRALFHRWALTLSGPTECVVGSCSEGFERLRPAMADLVVERRVGASTWQLLDARATVERAARLIGHNPRITHCGDLDCVRCHDAVLGGPRQSS